MFFGGKNKSKKIILFDFRSSSVAASIISVNKENVVPKILFTERERYYFSEAPKSDEFIKRAQSNISSTFDNWASIKACYRFFDNKKIKAEIILNDHIKSTVLSVNDLN
jgi:hypothetical protein